MRKGWFISTSLLAFGLALPNLAQAQPMDTVALGSDYFTTIGPTFVILPGNPNPVPLSGIPLNLMPNGFGIGTTDTIVQRQVDATINPAQLNPGGGPQPGDASIPLQLTNLLLTGGGLFFTQDPNAPSTGKMWIYGDTTGGYFQFDL